MATDTEQLVLQLSADLRGFEKAMLKAAGEADRAAARVERRFEAMNRKAAKDFSDFGDQVRGVLATIGIATLGREIIQYGDAWVRVANNLTTAGVAAEKLGAAQDTVVQIALRTRSALDATATLFSRLLRSSEDLGANMAEVALVTETVNKALAGATQSERASAAIQLGQGLASGRLQGDELRSILENSRPLAEAIAKEFGVAVGQLKVLGAAGQLESRRVFKAILEASGEISDIFSRTNATVGDSFTNLQTRLTQYVGTSDKARAASATLAGAINFVANNIDALADATIIAATVIGGTRAGAAIGRAIVALGTMTAGLTATAGAARAASMALAFFGGPIGVAIAGVGVALGLVATQTDLLAVATQGASRAAERWTEAQQVIEDLAAETAGLDAALAAAAESSQDLTAATNVLTPASAGAQRAMELEARAALDLANAQRQARIETLKTALAAQEAALRSAEIQNALSNLSTFTGPTNPFGVGPSRAIADLDAIERDRLARQQQAEEIRRRVQAARDAIAQIQGQIDRAEAPGPGTVGGVGQLGADLRTLRPAAAGAAGGGGGGGETPAQIAQRQRDALAALDQAAALSLARAQRDTARVAALEDAEQVERRTQALIEAGLGLSDARVRAEREVAAERAAVNAVTQEQLEISGLQDSIDLARARSQISLADALADELEMRRRIADLMNQGLTRDEAEARARAYVEAMREVGDAIAEARQQERDLNIQLEQARASGDERAARAIERRLDLEQRIAELREMGVGAEQARTRAKQEIQALEEAGARGEFRSWFSEAGKAALEGDLGDFFQSWLRGRTARGMEQALNDIADQLFNAFQGAIRPILEGGDGTLSDAIGRLFGSQQKLRVPGFGGGMIELGKSAESTAGVLRSKLTASAAAAAVQVAVTGTAAAAGASATASKATADIAGSVAMTRLSAAANKAAAALARISTTSPGGKDGGAGILSSVLNSLFQPRGFGGFRAAGGPVLPGLGYIVGERGPEMLVPRQPAYVVPNGAARGGGTVQIIDQRQISITGASTAEMAQLRRLLDQDMASRRAQVVGIVQDAFARRVIK